MISWLGALIKWLILLPVIIVVVLLAVANDQVVPVRFNPFDVSDTALVLNLPLYQIGFAIFVLGVLCGGYVTWNGQRKYRLQARDKGFAAALWRNRAEEAQKTTAGNARLIAARPEKTGT